MAAMRADRPVDRSRSTTLPRSECAQLRWASRASTIDGIERELSRIWAQPKLTAEVDGVEVRHIAARTSVMNLVVIAQQAEDGQHGAAIIGQLTGRHPSRTLILSSADPDGPGWLDARITAQCILPRADAPEICAETIYITAGGDTGRHLDAIVEPLLIHDLPVTVWWPGEARLESQQARDVLASADRLVVDGASWHGDGLARLRELARVATANRIAVFDFALARQSRWREAIASTFDMPDFLPYLRSLRRVAVTYGTHDESGQPGHANLVKPLYHVAWLASRLGLDGDQAAQPGARLARAAPARASSPAPGRGHAATLRQGNSDVAVVVRPVLSIDRAGHDPAGRAPVRAARLGAAGRRDGRGRSRSGSGPGRTASRSSTAGSMPPGGPRPTCWPRRSRPAATIQVADGAVRMAALIAAQARRRR